MATQLKDARETSGLTVQQVAYHMANYAPCIFNVANATGRVDLSKAYKLNPLTLLATAIDNYNAMHNNEVAADISKI